MATPCDADGNLPLDVEVTEAACGGVRGRFGAILDHGRPLDAASTGHVATCSVAPSDWRRPEAYKGPSI